MIFYTSPEDVNLIDDGERSANSDFRDDIIKLFESYILESNINIVRLSGTVEERLQTIKKTLNDKGLEINIL